MGKGSDFWLDDPEWELLRRKAENRSVSKKIKRNQQTRPLKPMLELPREEPRAEVTKQIAEKEVVLSLKLKLPRVRLPNLRQLLRLLYNRFYVLETRYKVALWAGAGLLCLFSVIGVVKPFKNNNASTNDEPASAQEQAKAEFNPLVPLENLTDANGAQSKPEFKYDKEKKVLGYVAGYNGANLTISQQQLPKELKSDPAKLMATADSIKADKRVDTQKGTAYIATDEKTKAQTAVFATDDVLVFVRSNKSLDDDEWQMYINQLNPAE